VGDRDAKVEEGSYIASRITGAKYVELPGEDHLIFAGNQDEVVDEVEAFLRNVDNTPLADTVLATSLFVRRGSTAELDHEQHQMLERFHALARREAEWFKGRAATVGDDCIATFDGPARAIRAACAISESASRLGIRIKAGLHAGLCQMSGKKISGPAVETTGKIAEQAKAGEILASNSVVDLVSGSGIEFENRAGADADSTMQVFSVVCQSTSSWRKE